jgi:two-component system chemotaxis sensor kinase CheA
MDDLLREFLTETNESLDRVDAELVLDLQSAAGVGTAFTIKIPLTLAIVSSLLVEAGGERFAMPQLSVLELVQAGNGEHRIERIKDTPVLRLRKKLLPLIYLKEMLRLGDRASGACFVVVTQVGSQVFGIVVDGVSHTEEIVIKPMSSKLRHIAVFSGTTILGDGSVIMIIDPNGIAQALGGFAPSVQADKSDGADSEEMASDDLTPLLVFRAGSQQPKAVPLSLISRLEEIDCRRIEVSDGRHLVQYRDQLMPLLRVDTRAGIKQEGTQPILVFSDHGRSMGLVVDEIADIVEERLDIEVASDRPGVLGYAVVKGSATEIIDVGHYLPLAFDDWLNRRDMKTAPRPRTVLLVDDSPFFRDMLSPLIKAAGYQVISVGSAEQALAAAKSETRIDLVITDIEMPDMDGFELASALRANPRTSAIPIIALSAVVSADVIERGRAVGFHDFVAKFDRTGLVAALKEQSTDLHRVA